MNTLNFVGAKCSAQRTVLSMYITSQRCRDALVRNVFHCNASASVTFELLTRLLTYLPTLLVKDVWSLMICVTQHVVTFVVYV